MAADADPFAERSRAGWNSFVKSVTAIVAVIVVTLVLLAVFLV